MHWFAKPQTVLSEGKSAKISLAVRGHIHHTASVHTLLLLHAILSRSMKMCPFPENSSNRVQLRCCFNIVFNEIFYLVKVLFMMWPSIKKLIGATTIQMIRVLRNKQTIYVCMLVTRYNKVVTQFSGLSCCWKKSQFGQRRLLKHSQMFIPMCVYNRALLYI